MDMYNDLKKSEDEKAELLQNMFGPNRESKLSKLLYYFFNDKSEYQIAGASRADTKQNEVYSENVPQKSKVQLQDRTARMQQVVQKVVRRKQSGGIYKKNWLIQTSSGKRRKWTSVEIAALKSGVNNNKNNNNYYYNYIL